jgi:hypothetical protein
MCCWLHVWGLFVERMLSNVKVAAVLKGPLHILELLRKSELFRKVMDEAQAKTAELLKAPRAEGAPDLKPIRFTPVPSACRTRPLSLFSVIEHACEM